MIALVSDRPSSLIDADNIDSKDTLRRSAVHPKTIQSDTRELEPSSFDAKEDEGKDTGLQPQCVQGMLRAGCGDAVQSKPLDLGG